MQKPKGMSRKDYHAMKRIVRDQLSDPFAMVQFENSSALGFVGIRHDEGFSASYVSVSIGDKPGMYEVNYDTNGRDCDGPHSTHDEFVVAKAGKRKRYYMSRDWKRNRPEGKFGTKSAFRIVKQGRSSQRDYYAEAAGY